MATNNVTVEDVLSVLDYAPDTGLFAWRAATAPRKNPAGHINKHGYVIIKLFNRAVKAHRLAWLCMTGKWPDLAIDHINGCRHDNRFANLREATASQNGLNRFGPRKDKRRCQYANVYLASANRKKQFYAAITVNQKSIYLGHFATAQEAHAAVMAFRSKAKL